MPGPAAARARPSTTRRRCPSAGAERGIERREGADDPEREALLADSVGLALLRRPGATLAPAERIAFVLHDLFAVPFDEIAAIVGRSPTAARQLASRARRRVQGAPVGPEAELAGHRKIVAAFLSAMRHADFRRAPRRALDPDVAVRHDGPHGPAREVRGARDPGQGRDGLQGRTRSFVRGRRSSNGAAGLVFAPRGRLTRAPAFTFEDGRIAEVDVITDPARVRALEVAVRGVTRAATLLDTGP